MPPDVPPDALERFREMPVSEVPGQFSELVPTTTGGVWVGPYSPLYLFHPRREGGTWTALDADGMPIARVRVPDGFSPHTAAGDYVLGVYVDEFGVEWIERREIARRDDT